MIQVRRTLKGEIWIEAVNATGEPYYLPGDERRLLGIILEIVQHSGRKSLRFTNSEASHGFGPLVYDLAMELASSDEFGGLCTGTGTSPEADALWEQYRRHRQDVTFTELAKDNPLITAGVIVPEYAFLCTKKRALLTELEQSGKIANVEGTKDISSTIADSEDDEEVDEQLKKLLDCDEQ